MTRRVVYLSGRIAGLSYVDASRDRNKAKEDLLAAGWDILDPMRPQHMLEGQDHITVDSDSNMTDASIVFRDLDDIRRADALIVLSGSQPSWGTAMEWSYAAITLGKPVVVVDPEETGRDSPWCRRHAVYFAHTTREAVAWLIMYLDRGYQLEG